MKVSALIVAYNHEPYIAQAIEGALMQETDFDYEVVISEDCSTDGTRAVVEDYEARYPDRIRVFYSPQNLGGVKNFVDTYAECRGDYVALLEGDDYWTAPEKLQRQANFLDRHPECSMCAHGLIEVHEDGSRPPVAWVASDQKEVSTLEDLIRHNFVYWGSAMLRKEAFDDYPEWVYDAPFGDHPLWIQVARRGAVGFINRFYGVYRVHAGGVWSGAQAAVRTAAVIEFYERLERELGAEQRPLVRRMITRMHAQLACERADVPERAVVLVASDGEDPDLAHVYGRGRPQPLDDDGFLASLEAAAAEGAQFLLFPATALPWLAERPELRRALDERHDAAGETPHALLYALR
jgi:hypothetical protein